MLYVRHTVSAKPDGSDFKVNVEINIYLLIVTKLVLISVMDVLHGNRKALAEKISADSFTICIHALDNLCYTL